MNDLWGAIDAWALGHVSPRPVPLEAANASAAARRTSQQALYADDHAEAPTPYSDTSALVPAHACVRSGSQEVSEPVDATLLSLWAARPARPI